jgi:Flp pilus assembly protein TadG
MFAGACKVFALSKLRAFARDESGASIIIIGLTLPAIIGAMALAAELSYWQQHQRALQNAADAAAIAAATNNGSSYANEAKAVAALYGFQDGTGNVHVTVANPASAPGCTANCYTVSISDAVPLYLSSIVGYRGNTTVGSQRATNLTAGSVATVQQAYSYCVLALASSGAQGITSNGAPKADLAGCNTMSNTSATCHGHNLNANVGDAHGTDDGCGIQQKSNAPTVTDPYSSLASSIPADSCNGTYPQEPAKKKDPPLPADNQWSGSMNLGVGTVVVCGDQQLIGNTVINNTVVVIENGQLDTAPGYTLSGTGLTIVFTGTNGGSYQHIPTGGGTFDISAPTSGAWSGVAIYQDPNLTTNVDISAAGNSPTWKISGLVYLPHSSVTFSGAVGKSSEGANCFVMVVDNITINGTGSIFAGDNNCQAAGLVPPRGGSRGTLVN